MTRRALQLLNLRRPSLVLDVGCGSGLSGSILSSAAEEHAHGEYEDDDGDVAISEEDGDDLINGNPNHDDTSRHQQQNAIIANGPHTWIGLDISASMLSIALERDVEGDLLLADVGQGIPFRPGSFDAAISISALQWLCCINDTSGGGEYASAAAAADNPTSLSASASSATLPLRRFFAGLHAALRRGARAVCQFYPRDAKQRDLICREAVRAGFSAGVLEDDPGTKHVKLYLVLRVGGGEEEEDDDDEDDKGESMAGMASVADGAITTTSATGGGSGYHRSRKGGDRDITGVVSGLDNVDVLDRRKKGRDKDKKKTDRRDPERRKGSKSWILKKKAQMERKGRVVKPSSKYTGRKRRIAF